MKCPYCKKNPIHRENQTCGQLECRKKFIKSGKVRNKRKAIKRYLYKWGDKINFYSKLDFSSGICPFCNVRPLCNIRNKKHSITCGDKRCHTKRNQLYLREKNAYLRKQKYGVWEDDKEQKSDKKTP